MPSLKGKTIRARSRSQALKIIRKFQRDLGYTVTKVSLKDKRKLSGNRGYIWENVTIWSKKRKR